MTIEFRACLDRFTRDNQDASKITLACDSQQLGEVIKIPVLKLLIVKIEVVQPENKSIFDEEIEGIN
jgi:hypothetical protein